MSVLTKSLLRQALPPIVWRALLKISGRGNRWLGNYPDWASAVNASGGYDSETIFEKVRHSARAVRDGTALWERDTVCFCHEEFNWQLLACLMTVAARSGGRLHVLDFGGALGSTYMQHRKFLTKLPECTWSVVEQRHVVTCGELEFKNDTLDFFDDIKKCFLVRPINVVLLSSVLQYLERPYELLEQVVGFSPAAIIIDRTPIAEAGERITVQHVPKSIYSASYPCRFLDQGRIEDILKDDRELFPWYSSPVDPPGFLGIMSLSRS